VASVPVVVVVVVELVRWLVIRLSIVLPKRVHLVVENSPIDVPGSQEEFQVPVTLVVPCSHVGLLLPIEKLVVRLPIAYLYHVPLPRLLVPFQSAHTKHQATYLTCTT
jgi:hypothetical protein